jgi:hypothetical protein
MRAFHLGWPMPQTKPAKLLPSSGPQREKSISQTASAKLNAIPVDVAHHRFPLPWSHYARLLAVRNAAARAFYESEALRGGWTIRQLDRQIVGLILCAERDHAVAKYALEGLPNKVLAAEYRTTLPQEGTLAKEIERTRRQLDGQRPSAPAARQRSKR